MNEYNVDIEEVLNDLRTQWIVSNNYTYNSTAFTKIRNDSQNIMMCCPYHNETKPSFGMKVEYPYLFNCFSCGETGDLIDLVSKVFDIDYIKAYRKIVKDYFTFNIYEEKKEEIFEIPTEEEILKYRSKRHSYIEARGISDYTLQKYEVGYDEEKYSITFPVRDLYGDPSFIVRRNVGNKFYHIPKNAPKRDVLYGLNYLKGRTEKVYIVEGPIDVLSCYEARLPAIALLGRSMSRNHVKLLQKAGINEVMLFLDNDKWGVKGNHDIYKLLSKTPLKIKVVKYPESRGVAARTQCNDPNDLLRYGLLDNITVVSYIKYYLKCSED